MMTSNHKKININTLFVAILLIALCSNFQRCESFTATPLFPPRTAVQQQQIQRTTTTLSLQFDDDSLASTSSTSRRSFFHNTIQTIVTTTGIVSILVQTPQSTVAAVDDMDMPSPEEQQKQTDEAYAERLRKKAELQRKAAAPKTYSASFQNEISKQSELKKQTKVERRNAMCEELGRGC